MKKKSKFVEFEKLQEHPKYKTGLLPILGRFKDLDGRSFVEVEKWIDPTTRRWKQVEDDE